MTGFTEFIDITGSNASRAPLVAGGVRAYYATGTDGIEETAAQVTAARAAGMGVILIDQTPGLSLFAAGDADVADIENYAGTDAAAHTAVAARQARGEPSVLYVSYSALSALQAAVANPAGVSYWVADYSWSLAEAETLLTQNPSWVACQYGDPASNPATLVPGTSVTLAAAQADIDVAKAEWAALFLGGTPAPAPAPPAPVPSTWQEDMMRQLPTLSQGASGDDVRSIQGLCCARGHTTAVDGSFGPLTKAAVEAVQTAAKISVDGVVGAQTWPALIDVS